MSQAIPIREFEAALRELREVSTRQDALDIQQRERLESDVNLLRLQVGITSVLVAVLSDLIYLSLSIYLSVNLFISLRLSLALSLFRSLARSLTVYPSILLSPPPPQFSSLYIFSLLDNASPPPPPPPRHMAIIR